MLIAAIPCEYPPCPVGEVQFQHGIELGAMRGIEHRNEQLHASAEVARPEVGRSTAPIRFKACSPKRSGSKLPR